MVEHNVRRLGRFKKPKRDSRLGWPGLGTSFMMNKQHSLDQSPIPPGFKFTSRAKIPIKHKSYKPLQDKVERDQVNEINNTAHGQRRDFLIARLEEWRQACRPTGGAPTDPRYKNEVVETQRKGLGKWADEIAEHDQVRKTRRVKVSDMVANLTGDE